MKGMSSVCYQKHYAWTPEVSWTQINFTSNPVSPISLHVSPGDCACSLSHADTNTETHEAVTVLSSPSPAPLQPRWSVPSAANPRQSVMSSRCQGSSFVDALKAWLAAHSLVMVDPLRTNPERACTAHVNPLMPHRTSGHRGEAAPSPGNAQRCCGHALSDLVVQRGCVALFFSGPRQLRVCPLRCFHRKWLLEGCSAALWLRDLQKIGYVSLVVEEGDTAPGFLLCKFVSSVPLLILEEHLKAAQAFWWKARSCLMGPMLPHGWI